MGNSIDLFFHTQNPLFISYERVGVGRKRQSGGVRVKKEDVIVRCIYEESSKPVEEVLKESFQLFLQKELNTFANGAGYRV